MKKQELPAAVEVDLRSGYEQADDFIKELRAQKTDTILFYKRTCISCCDFYTVFWAANGKYWMKKFSYGHKENLPLEDSELKSVKLFYELRKNFDELKSTVIKENEHFTKKGPVIVYSTHYCYSGITVYTEKDSIKTSIEDHAFDPYINMDPLPGVALRTNDNYAWNINSKWNLFQQLIEEEIAADKNTSQLEYRTLRVKKTA